MASTMIAPSLVQPSRKRRIAFFIPVVLMTLMLIIFTGILAPALPYIFIGWFGSAAETSHHLHEFVLSAFFWSLLIGAGAQFFRPQTKVAPLMHLLGAISLLLFLSIVTNSFFPPVAIFFVLALLIFFLHPTPLRERFTREGKAHRLLLVLTGLAVIPAVIYASEHLGLQSSHMSGDEHAMFFHWGATATVALCLILFGLLASLRLSGWKITAWLTSVMAVILGVTSLAFPAQASGVGPTWGIIAIIWGVAFALTTQFVKLAD